MGLPKANVEKWGENVMFDSRSMARAEVECVIGIDAISDGGDVFACRKFVQHGEEFVLAKVAAVPGIGAVRGIVHFVGFDEFVVDGKFLEERGESVAIVSRVAGRDCGNGERAFAEGFVSGPGEVSGVSAARESDD